MWSPLRFGRKKQSVANRESICLHFFLSFPSRSRLCVFTVDIVGSRPIRSSTRIYSIELCSTNHRMKYILLTVTWKEVIKKQLYNKGYSFSINNSIFSLKALISGHFCFFRPLSSLDHPISSSLPDLIMPSRQNIGSAFLLFSMPLSQSFFSARQKQILEDGRGRKKSDRTKVFAANRRIVSARPALPSQILTCQWVLPWIQLNTVAKVWWWDRASSTGSLQPTKIFDVGCAQNQLLLVQCKSACAASPISGPFPFLLASPA